VSGILVVTEKRYALFDGRCHRRTVIAIDLHGFDIPSFLLRNSGRQLAHAVE